MTTDLLPFTYLTICIASIFASGLTLFTGFGLGTLLMPFFAIFFSVDIAIASTALVHLVNNLFKFFIFGKHANKKTVLLFGIPALIAAFAGAKSLLWFSQFDSVFHYTLFDKKIEILPINLIMGFLMIAFAMLEMFPHYQRLSFKKKYFVIGGVLSGFFGGLSGHQGAFRSAFLIKAGLSKESFIGTGVVIACLVDTIRIFVYGIYFNSTQMKENATLLILATFSAFLGVKLGSLYVEKVTIKTLQKAIAVLLGIIAIALGSGFLDTVNLRKE